MDLREAEDSQEKQDAFRGLFAILNQNPNAML